MEESFYYFVLIYNRLDLHEVSRLIYLPPFHPFQVDPASPIVGL
jgi:hypothetical protein